MVAPAVLAAASKAAKVAKAAKSAAQVASGQGGKGGGGKKKNNNLKWALIIAGVGAMPTLGVLLVAILLIMALIGGIGGGAAQAACGGYGENAGAGNTSDKAATNPIMPAGKMYMPSDTARDEIPPKMILASMRAAARYDGLDWTIIAGQMYQETRYGQDKSAAPGGDNGYGFKGLLQFGDWAWGQFGEDGNGDGQKDRYGVDDLAFAAANYMHALKAESNPWKALLGYSGSLETNTVYPRVVLTQAARYRGTLTDDKDLINRWYAHLKTTVEKNPSFPVLGQTSDIPEPVGNNAQPNEALSIRSKGPRSWSTPPLEGGGQGGTTTAMAPMGFSRPLAAPLRPDDPPATTSGKDWQWPMKEGTYKLGTKYHQEGPHWSLGYHTGVDLEAPTGTPIYAPADGKVVKVSSGGAYGNQTRLEHANGVITLYAHQSSVSVKLGDTVKRGDQIGKVGETGNVTGAHLHWEVLMPGVDDPFRSGQDNGPGEIDPAAWLEGKITASPDYGGVPGGNGTGKDAEYRDCAEGARARPSRRTAPARPDPCPTSTTPSSARRSAGHSAASASPTSGAPPPPGRPPDVLRLLQLHAVDVLPSQRRQDQPGLHHLRPAAQPREVQGRTEPGQAGRRDLLPAQRPGKPHLGARRRRLGPCQAHDPARPEGGQERRVQPLGVAGGDHGRLPGAHGRKLPLDQRRARRPGPPTERVADVHPGPGGRNALTMAQEPQKKPRAEDDWTIEIVLLVVGVLALLSAAWLAARLGAAFTDQPEPPGNPFSFAIALAKGDYSWPGGAASAIAAAEALLLAGLITAGYRIRRWLRDKPDVDRAAKHMVDGTDLGKLTMKGAAATAARLGVKAEVPGVFIGRSVKGRQPLFGSFEDMHVDIWGPRTGKTTRRAIPAILAAPGAVLVTSNKRDIVDGTRGPRQARGQVWVFDPQQVAQEPPTWWWNPSRTSPTWPRPVSWPTTSLRARATPTPPPTRTSTRRARTSSPTCCSRRRRPSPPSPRSTPGCPTRRTTPRSASCAAPGTSCPPTP